MAKKKTKKNKIVPRTDANQNVREHAERVRKQQEYVARKIEEYQARQKAEMAKVAEKAETKD